MDATKRSGGPRRWRLALAGCGALVALTLWVARPMLFPPSGDRFGNAEAPADVRVPSERSTASVLLVGDTHFGESYASDPKSSVVAKRGYHAPLNALRPLLASADVVVANLETPLTRNTRSPLRLLKKWTHWGNPEASVDALSRAGVDAVSLANNHANDALGPGLRETLEALQGKNIATFGGGTSLRDAARPLRIELPMKSGTVRIAIVGAFERQWDDFFCGAYATSTGGGVYPLAQRTLAGQVRALKAADPQLFVIGFPHWGKNYSWRTPAQAKLAKALVEAGADAIIGHGAHVFQEAELVAGRLVLYSLGNFVFLSPGRYQTSGLHPWSVAARLDFVERGGSPWLSAALFFIASDNRKTKYRPRLLAGTDFETAAKTLMEGPALDEASRETLRKFTRFERDHVGQHLRIDLGPLRPHPH